jgi:hypothetical protein
MQSTSDKDFCSWTEVRVLAVSYLKGGLMLYLNSTFLTKTLFGASNKS